MKDLKKNVESPEPKGSGKTKKAALPAGIDYRLRNRAVIRAFKNGQVYRSQICDAHPELMRAAKGVGERQEVPCPVCSEKEIVLVKYLFGGRLGPSGRCMADAEELRRTISTKKGIFTCYVIEVCLSCSWNLISQSFSIQGQD